MWETGLSFIDIHAHILPGLDDGPSSMEESLEMIDMAMKDGISHIFATPHIIDGLYDNKAGEIMNAVDDLRRHVPDGIKILYGADVRISFDLITRIENREIPTLNDSGYMLIEFPTYNVPPHVDNLIFNLHHRGVTPILTHPERHLRLMQDLPAIGKFRDAGAMCQITAMSITGDFGKNIKKVCLAMIEKELVDIVASDAHDPRHRTPVLSKAYEEVKREFGNDIADSLFFTNPKKILDAIKP